MSNQSSKVLSFSVIYEEAPEGGYVAYVPALQGCHSQGESIEETEKNIKEAIELYCVIPTNVGIQLNNRAI